MNGEHKSICWTVSDSSENARLELVNKFVTWCFAESERMTIDPSVTSAVERLKEMVKNPPSGFDKSDILQLTNHLKAYTTLSCYGFNSQRYDLSIIFEVIY